MQCVTLKKKQRIVKKVVKRIDRITKEIQFFDQKDNLILGLPYFSEQDKDQFGRYKNDSMQWTIFEGNIFSYQACESHENHLLHFMCSCTYNERIK